jgi:hypothetical protein
MFFIIGITNGANDLGIRKCKFFTCCASDEVMASFTCRFNQFILFFIPLFRFHKRYFVSCPNCGTIYEMSKEEGQRLESDYSAEINPDALFIVQGASKKICPNCKCSVAPDCRFCPNCGNSLL